MAFCFYSNRCRENWTQLLEIISFSQTQIQKKLVSYQREGGGEGGQKSRKGLRDQLTVYKVNNFSKDVVYTEGIQSVIL